MEKYEHGVLADSLIKNLIGKMNIYSSDPFNDIGEGQIQPSSFEPRIGDKVYVRDYIDRKDNDWGKPLEITDGFKIEKGKVYKVPLLERISLPGNMCGEANPKSRIGRSGLHARLIADNCLKRYDELPFGYRGPISLELTSRVFDYLIKPGMKFNQIRVMNGYISDTQLSGDELGRFWHSYRSRENPETGKLNDGTKFSLTNLLFYPDGKEIPFDKVDISHNAIVLHASTKTGNPSNDVMYLARDDVKESYDLRNPVNKFEDFFERVKINEGPVKIDPLRFSLSSSMEVINCPENMVMITTPIDPSYGDFMGDHAGFVDPGFLGTLTFEPIIYETAPLKIDEGTEIIGLRVVPLVGEIERKYGQGLNVHQGQRGVKAGPHFERSD